jgi:hypothetical protein
MLKSALGMKSSDLMLRVECVRPEEKAVLGSAITHARLMQVSEERLEQAAQEGSPQDRLIASRVIDRPSAWVLWQSEHARLMRAVAVQRRTPGQISTLKSACFALIHRKALFEHLRDQKVSGVARQQLLHFFHPSRGYSHALAAEYESYLRAACSYLCSSHVGTALINDGVFQDPLQRYEALYAEYFRMFCEGKVATDKTVSDHRDILPYLKHQITELRQAILNMPRSVASVLREDALRRPTGDTEKLRVDALRARFRA